MPRSKSTLVVRRGHKSEVTVREIKPGLHVVLLPDGPSRWGSFGVGLVLEIVGLAAILLIPVLFPQKLENFRNYWTTSLESPVIQPWHPKGHRLRPAVITKESAPASIVDLGPKTYSPVASAPVKKQVLVKRSDPAPEIASATPNLPLPMIASEIPNLQKPREDVRLAGFGMGSGVEERAGRNQGAIASSGFADGVDGGRGRSVGGRSGVREGGFGTQIDTAATPTQRPVPVSAKTSPVQILYKPRPLYTEDARAHRIEGDVVLQVLFTSSGEVQVEKVLHGLGHGLNESAVAAAREIRFRPAEFDGQPKDSEALIHITFELAY